MIAIALSCDPVLLIADEPTTALDVTVQARILDLLRAIQEERGIAIILISHDLGVVAEMCKRTTVMYAGHVVEVGATRDLLDYPRHPYTEGLLQALPENATNGRLLSIPGNVPSLMHQPPGCAFAPRCTHAVAGLCDTEQPILVETKDREVSCFRVEEISLRGVKAP
jgi:oligopeptide/dipeptide ABC transporter ATP-binding protein